MPATVSVAYKSKVTITQTFTGDYIDSDNNTVAHDGLDVEQTYTASTTPPVTMATTFRTTLSSGNATINLLALAGLTAGETINTNGLKIQLAKFRNLSSNANAITIQEGASNGHPLLGASFSATLQPGQELTFANNGVDVGTDVAAADSTWDVSGTGSQILEVGIVAG